MRLLNSIAGIVWRRATPTIFCGEVNYTIFSSTVAAGQYLAKGQEGVVISRVCGAEQDRRKQQPYPYYRTRIRPTTYEYVFICSYARTHRCGPFFEPRERYRQNFHNRQLYRLSQEIPETKRSIGAEKYRPKRRTEIFYRILSCGHVFFLCGYRV